MATTGPTISGAGGPPTEEKPKAWYKKLHKNGAVYIMLTSVLGGLYVQHEYKTKPDRLRAEFAKASADRVLVQPGPNDAQRLSDRRKFMQASAVFVDQYLSWKVTSAANVKPVQTEAALAVRQLETLSSELGKDAAFKKFLNENRYRWIDKGGMLGKTQSAAQLPETNQQLHVRLSLNSTRDLLVELRKDSRFESLLNTNRFTEAKKMVDGFNGAYLNSEIGVGYKPLPQAAQTGPRSGPTVR